MSSPTPTHGLTLQRDSKYRNPRMELFEMYFSNKNKGENKGDIFWANEHKPEDHPCAHLFPPVESPGSSSSSSSFSSFRGRIFITIYNKHVLIYNSDTSIYADWPLKKKTKGKRRIGDTDLPSTNDLKLQQQNNSAAAAAAADDDSKEIIYPMAGGINVWEYFQITIHPHTGNDDVEAQYDSLAQSWYLDLEHLFLPFPTDDIGLCRFPCYDPPRTLDKPFEFTIDTAYLPLTLEGVVISDSKEVNVEVTWNRSDGVETVMYVAGWVTVVSEKLEDKVSILLDNPPGKVVKALTGQKLPLLRSVVAVPYMSAFQVEVTLVCSYSSDENSPRHEIVDDAIVFQNLDLDEDARDTSLMPYRPYSYESKKIISGNGGYLEVKVNVDYH